MALMKNVVSGKFRGNAGAFKFAQSAGRDVVSERVYTNKSKGFGASYKQRVQRCKIMNLANVYGAYKSLFAKAFEGKKATQSPYNAFTSANLGTSNIHLTKKQAEIGCFSSVGLTMSKGSLPSFREDLQDDDGYNTGLKLGNSFDYESANVSTLSKILLDNNDFLKEGDQLTFIAVNRNVIVPGDDLFSGDYSEMIFIEEFTIDLNDPRPLNTLPNYRSLFDGLYFSWDESTMHIKAPCGACIILSRRVNGRLLVSTQHMVDTGDGNMPYDKYSSAENLAAAVASYGSQELALLDPGSEAQPTV